MGSILVNNAPGFTKICMPAKELKICGIGVLLNIWVHLIVLSILELGLFGGMTTVSLT